MSKEYLQQMDPTRQKAVTELTGMIRQPYPTASFEVDASEDDPTIIHIIATVDLNDPDEVTDLVIERMVELQLDEGIPVYVIPIRTPERHAALLRQQRSRMNLQLRSPTYPLLPANPSL